ncbi:MAG: hypothetical protein J6S21_07135, partial [Victivallales bacterium]|nr:hypothetical protein [Victivallales bacterium]
NVVASTNAAFKPYRFDRTADGKAEVSDGRANIPDALAMEKWDVVTVQQASHDSWNPSTFQPEGDRLVAKIRELAPQAHKKKGSPVKSGDCPDSAHPCGCAVSTFSR